MTIPTQRKPPSAVVLTHEERRMLALLASGLRHAQIAERVHKKPRTVSTNLLALYRKIGAKTGPHAVAMAIKFQWISLGESE